MKDIQAAIALPLLPPQTHNFPVDRRICSSFVTAPFALLFYSTGDMKGYEKLRCGDGECTTALDE